MQPTDVAGRAHVAFRSTGSGEDVLFLHGWAGSGAYFDETIAALDQTRTRATTFDLRGHGRSGDGSAEWSLDLIADDTLAVMDAAEIDAAVLVGFSMSGKFAQYVTLAAPDRVRGQILVAGSPAGEIPLPPDVIEDWCARAGSPERMVDLMNELVPGPKDEEALARFGREAALISREALEGTMAACLPTSFADRVSETAVPTLVVAGAQDAMFTPEMLRATMVDAIPGARLAVVDCGHEIPFERPRELAALIEAFLAGVS
jgi:3-oxoadipate enol-lactonase/4-carboxymuconolactone decarboxylase